MVINENRLDCALGTLGTPAPPGLNLCFWYQTACTIRVLVALYPLALRFKFGKFQQKDFKNEIIIFGFREIFRPRFPAP